MSNQYDFAIVGAGIAGVSLAARLAGKASVLILEQEPAPAYHSTGRSAALYAALYGNETIRAITRASRSHFDRPPAGFSDYPLLTPRGVLYAGGRQDQATIDEICKSPLARRISTAQAIDLVPVLTEESARACAYEPDAFDVDVHGLHQGFLRMARTVGATLVCNARLMSAERRAGVWALQTGNGHFQASILVNAAGAWADQVAVIAGAKPLGLQPLLRTAMIIEAPGPQSASWPAMFAADESFYFKPDAGLLMASLADEKPSDPCDAQPDDFDVAVCVDRIESRTRMQIKRVVRSWAGLRTFAADRNPVVGFDTGRQGFFWLAGQGGYGVQTAPALSEIAAALILCRKIPQYILDEGFLPDSISPKRLV